jgi:hypothetical protein
MRKEKNPTRYSDANSYVEYMLKNIQDSQDADLETLLLNHNKTMGSIKELYRSDIENKTLRTIFKRVPRQIVRVKHLAPHLLRRVDKLYKHRIPERKTATGVDYYNEMYVMVKHENDTFDSMKDLVKDLYSGDSKRSNTRYSIWISRNGYAGIVVHILYNGDNRDILYE